jgi:general secretion pathway protein C
MSNTLIAQLNNPAVLLRINQRAATVMSVLLIIACAYLLVEMTWLLFPQGDSVTLPAQQKINSANNKQAKQEQFRKLTSANIFGLAQTTTAQEQTKAPETRLNLTLRGVLAAKPMSLATAIIAQGKTGKEDIYSVGDKMQGGVLIKEIFPEYITLERNGRLETLKLEKISDVPGFTPSPKSTNLPSSRRGSPAAALTEIRSNILKNPASFGEYALPVVVKENGKQIGYRLRPQEKGDMLAELGLQSSDVITEINGVKLDKPQNGISALRKLSTAKNLNIVVKRNGAEVPLNISLQ